MGPAGAMGPTGSQGATGATGATGPAGALPSLPRVSLFATAAQTMAPGADVAFDVQGAVSADTFTVAPTATGTGVTINAPGTYMILWSASVTTSCGLGVTLDRFQVSGLTAVGNPGRLFAHGIVQITNVPTLLELKNRVGTCSIQPDLPVLVPASVGASLVILRMPS